MSVSKTVWAGRIISGIIVLPFTMSAVMKFMMNPQVIQGMDHLGIPQSLVIPIAVLELMCVVVYAIPATSVLGAVLFTGYMGGTILTHLRVGEAPVMQIIFALLIWLGIYLREPGLKGLLPVRK